jgi:hypothetical protein
VRGERRPPPAVPPHKARRPPPPPLRGLEDWSHRIRRLADALDAAAAAAPAAAAADDDDARYGRGGGGGGGGGGSGGGGGGSSSGGGGALVNVSVDVSAGRGGQAGGGGPGGQGGGPVGGGGDAELSGLVAAMLNGSKAALAELEAKARQWALARGVSAAGARRGRVCARAPGPHTAGAGGRAVLRARRRRRLRPVAATPLRPAGPHP